MGTQYHKIQTVFKRDPATNHKTLLYGEWARPEFKYLEKVQWVFTEKVDGTNIRIIWHGPGENLSFAGRTDNAQIPAPLINRLNERFTQDLLRVTFGIENSVELYGEGYGPRIQKGGGNYRKDQDFVLFDVRINGNWQDRNNVEGIAETLEIDVVPVIDQGDLWDMVGLVQDGFRSEWGDFTAEGVVARPLVELQSRTGERIITKIKHRDFVGGIPK